jgi:hypothetical protein
MTAKISSQTARLGGHGYDNQSHEPGRCVAQKTISWVISVTAYEQHHDPHYDRGHRHRGECRDWQL